MLLSDQSDVTIKVARFKGTDKVEIITNKELGYCCILKSVYNVLDYLDNFNIPSVKLTYPKRVEKYLIDKTALREAVINAIVHNDYVRGGSMPRNRELMRVFRDMELVENFGSGMHRILQAYDRSIFKISENFVMTEFKYDEEVMKQVRVSVGGDKNEPVNEPVKLTKATQQVLDCLKRKSDITIDAMVEEIGVARETVKRALKILREKGFIRRIGSDKTGYYEVLKK